MIDAYKIGVSIAMSNGVSAVLAVIQKDILGLNRAINMATGGLNRMKVAAVGFAGVAIGGAILGGIYELAKAGEKYTHQLEMMKLAGMDAAEVQKSIFAANRTSSSVLTTTPTENLQSIRELRAALNSAGTSPQVATEEAIKYLSVVQKAQAVMQTTAGGRLGAANGGVYEMVKALEEIRATQNPERFEKLLGGMVQASEAFGGKINSRDWFQTLKYTRGAGQFYNDDFITHYLPTLMQEMKAGGGSGAGGGPGAPLASLFGAVVGNTFSRSTMKLGEHLGLIDPSKVHVGPHGQITKDPGAWYGADTAASNPAIWIQKFLMPKLAAQMGGHMLDTGANGQYVHIKEVATTLATLFGNRTAQQMVGLLMNVQKMEGDRTLVQAAMNLGAAYNEIIHMDPPTVRRAVAEQWSRVTTDLGKAITPATTYLLFKLAEGLSYLAGVIERHPVITQWIMAFIAGLGVFLVTLGTVAIGLAAIAALGAGGAITAMIAGLIALWAFITLAPWDRIWGRLRSWFGQIITTASEWFRQIAASVRDDILSLCVRLTEGLRNIVHIIGDWISNLVGLISDAARRSGPADTQNNPFVQPQAYHPGAQNRPTIVHNTLYLDGEVVHRSVVNRMNRDAARPPTSTSRGDGRLNLLYPA